MSKKDEMSVGKSLFFLFLLLVIPYVLAIGGLWILLSPTGFWQALVTLVGGFLVATFIDSIIMVMGVLTIS